QGRFRSMSVVIRLMRAGAKKRPFYRVVAADSRRQRDGRFLEILGHYNPIAQPFELVIHKDRVESWLSKGAQPSEQVASLLRSLAMPVRSVKPARPAASASASPASPRAARRKPRAISARKAKKRAAKKSSRKAVAT